MASLLDTFMAHGRTVSNTVIGTASMTLSGGIILTGVWSTVSANGEGAFGGEQLMATAAVIVPAASNITRALIGQRGTYNGVPMRVSNIEIGTVESTVYFQDETEGTRL